MTEVAHPPRLRSAAERMRLYRERRRRGPSCVKVRLRRSEVDALIGMRIIAVHRSAGSYRIGDSTSSISRCKPNRSKADGDAQRREGDVSPIGAGPARSSFRRSGRTKARANKEVTT
jgi:hypothetical protein